MVGWGDRSHQFREEVPRLIEHRIVRSLDNISLYRPLSGCWRETAQVEPSSREGIAKLFYSDLQQAIHVWSSSATQPFGQSVPSGEHCEFRI